MWAIRKCQVTYMAHIIFLLDIYFHPNPYHKCHPFHRPRLILSHQHLIYHKCNYSPWLALLSFWQPSLQVVLQLWIFIRKLKIQGFHIDFSSSGVTENKNSCWKTKNKSKKQKAKQTNKTRTPLLNINLWKKEKEKKESKPTPASTWAKRHTCLLRV